MIMNIISTGYDNDFVELLNSLVHLHLRRIFS